MDDAERFVVDAFHDPPEHPRAMAVDAVPHHLFDKPADLAEAGLSIKLGHADRHLVTAHFWYEGTGARMHEPRLSGCRAEAWLGLHPPNKAFEIRGWQHQIEIQLADVLEIGRRDARVADIESFDDARADTT